MSWYHKGKIVNDCDVPEGAYGFVYLITHLQSGKIYVGKKALTHRTKTKLSKRARKGTRKRVAVGTKNSGWQTYYGSCIPLKEDVKKFGEAAFKREILEYTFSKGENTYVEIEQQILRKVLIVDSYNSWIGAKVWKHQLQKLRK